MARKARIKILIHALGTDSFAREVEAEWQAFKDGPSSSIMTSSTRDRVPFPVWRHPAWQQGK
jgi:sulfite reductase (NADPH) hemoprotein beta-component